MSKVLKKSEKKDTSNVRDVTDKSKTSNTTIPLNSSLELSDNIILPQFIPIYSLEGDEDTTGVTRYWKSQEPKDYEVFLADHPQDIHSWIEFAFLVPPKFVTP
jgi:hypothetical protein